MKTCKSGLHQYEGRRCQECVKIASKRPHRLETKKKYSKENFAHLKSIRLQAMYGITLEEYNQMFADQNGNCGICKRNQSEFTKALSVDHCHTTGEVRGLLCDDCNMGLGKFKDDEFKLQEAIKYLKR